MTNFNMDEINKLWNRVSKQLVLSLTLMVLSWKLSESAPIQIVFKVIIAIKHYLKALNDVDDIHLRSIKN